MKLPIVGVLLAALALSATATGLAQDLEEPQLELGVGPRRLDTDPFDLNGSRGLFARKLTAAQKKKAAAVAAAAKKAAA